MSLNIEARRVDRNTFDIFIGKQWSSHIRVRCNKQGLYRVSGMRLGSVVQEDNQTEKVDHNFLKRLNNIVAPNMPITYGQDMDTMYHNNMVI